MATIKTRADYYKKTKFFDILQPNPTEPENKSKKGDCVVRAFCIAANITWLEAFDILTTNARKTYNMPNDKENYDTVFKEYGFVRKQAKLTKENKRMTTEDFCKSHPKGAYILRLAHHLTAVVNGVCYDTWNPANKCIYFFYELKMK